MKPQPHGIIHTRSQALIDYADAIATKAHKGQNRKYTGEPYIVHPRGVARIVASITDDVTMICGALLHDTVEDTSLELHDIVEKFGYHIARVVDGLTDPIYPTGFNRASRVMANRMHSAAQPVNVHTVKLADLIHNTESITQCDPGFAKQYMAEKALLIGYLVDGDCRLVARAFDQLANYYSAQQQV